MSNMKVDAAIFVQHINGKSVFLDNEGNISSTPESFETNALSNGSGRVQWFAADGVSSIKSIIPKSGTDKVFKNPEPNADCSVWSAEVKESTCEATEDYTVVYVTNSGKEITIDPKIRAKPKS
ncbi:hypothetical protein [Reichenbachiella versicolor]|uniref:hypothetical protein n=1 Tax=Reichenbachiella versicolor TaxID=1821036 RepID=UPI000D6E34CD|nr:hypothetical protein [Reichenbachiella versicolor]